ncbi:MAG: hypothetical protein RIS52_335 [Pseudomonadota bacterium]|jgi:ApaG protein
MIMDAFFPYQQTSGDVIVRVAVNFLPEQSDPRSHRWFWAYHIRIENHGTSPVQLLTRRWEISDERGGLHQVEGDGVVGEQPVIQPGNSFDYVSGCPLNTPSGAMRGAYGMIDATGREFEAGIPEFLLKDPVTAA